MQFAVDIIKFAYNGFFFLPRTNEEYPVFGENIYSPMDGTVIKAENSIPDNIPYAGNYPYNTGNTVVIRKENLYLRRGSLYPV